MVTADHVIVVSFVTARAEGTSRARDKAVVPQWLCPFFPNRQKLHFLPGHVTVQDKVCTAARANHETEFWLLRCKQRYPAAASGNLERWQEQQRAALSLCPSHCTEEMSFHLFLCPPLCRSEGDVMARAGAAILGHEVTLGMRFSGKSNKQKPGSTEGIAEPALRCLPPDFFMKDILLLFKPLLF